MEPIFLPCLLSISARSQLANKRRAGYGKSRTICLCKTECIARFSQLVAGQFQPWRTHTSAPNAHLLLYLFDELDELGYCVHAQQRQEPAIQLKGLL